MYPSIKKTVFAMLTLVCIGPLKAETQYETITIAKGHFAQRQFSEGRGVLLGRLRAPDVSVDEKSSILTAFADFYCNDVGDYTQGMDYYDKAVRLKPDNATALKQIEYIRSQQNQHRQIDQLVKEMLSRQNSSSQPADLSALKEMNRPLETFITGTPDYYRSAEVFYCLGMYYADAGRERKAIESFRRALQIKPGIDFMLPVSKRIEVWHSRWVREVITICMTSTFAVMYFLTALLFYATRPWQWLKLRTIAELVLINILLCIVILAAQKWLAAAYAVSDEAGDLLSKGSIYLYTSMDSPGFGILAVFMTHLIIGFNLIFIFSRSIANLLKNKIIAAMIGGIAGTLIMASVISIYYMRNCDMKLTNTPDLSIKGLFDLSNAMIFPVKGIEPYLLTDPEAFPNPSVIHNVNPPLENWAKAHCPFDESHASEGQ
jgi:tetratricopeptide (TPR) repeat protein